MPFEMRSRINGIVSTMERFETFFGFKLGFWWAQQGSIFVFVILIFVYIRLMHNLDRRFGVSDDGAPPN